MKITLDEKKELEAIYQSFFNNEKIIRMKEIEMHRGSDTFTHSFKVAKVAIKRALRHKKVDLKAVLVGAILHDYYLYDWRRDRSLLKKHGKNHPKIAAKNAVEDFGIDEFVQSIIKAHMWPINFKDFPRSKEARIVNLADDHIALKESLTSRRFKAKRKEIYDNYIKSLF